MTTTKTDTETAFRAIPMTNRERAHSEKMWERVAKHQLRNLAAHRDHLPGPIKDMLAEVEAAEKALAKFRGELGEAEEAATRAAKADAKRAAEIARTGKGKFVPTHADALKRVEAATVVVEAARKRLRTLRRRALGLILEHQGEMRRALYPVTSTALRNIQAAADAFVQVVEENVEGLAAASLADEPGSVSAARPPKDLVDLTKTVSATVAGAVSREGARRAYVEAAIAAGGYEAHDDAERERQRAERFSDQRRSMGF